MTEENNATPNGAPEQPAAPGFPAADQASVTPQQPVTEPIASEQPTISDQPFVPEQPVVPEPPAPGQTAQYAVPQQPSAAPQPPAPGQYTAPQQPTQAMPNGYQAQPGQQPPMGYGYQGGGYGAPQPPTAAPTGPGSGKALAALLCGIGAIVFSGTVIVGVILGIIAIVLASQYVKSFGKEGKATGGKVCGIIGIVFSILALIFWIFSGWLIFTAVNEYNNSSSSYTYSYDSGSSSSNNSSDSNGSNDSNTTTPTDADEQAAIDAASAVLDELKNPTEADINEMAAGIDEGFASSSGFTSLSDIGVDPKEFAQWLISDLSYEIDDAFVYSDGTGTVYADVTTKDYYEFMGIFESNVTTFLNSDEAANLADEAAANAKVGELLKDAMAKTPTTVNFAYIDVKKVGSSWVVDEDSLDEIAQSIFGIYY